MRNSVGKKVCVWLAEASGGGGGNLIKLYDELDTLILAVEGYHQVLEQF